MAWWLSVGKQANFCALGRPQVARANPWSWGRRRAVQETYRGAGVDLDEKEKRPETITPTGGGGPVSVIFADQRLGGGVSLVNRSRFGRRSKRVEEEAPEVPSLC